jgi:hypothetical protein
MGHRKLHHGFLINREKTIARPSRIQCRPFPFNAKRVPKGS